MHQLSSPRSISSDPSLPLCYSNTMNLPLAQLICGMPPQIIPSNVPSINQHIADGTLLLPLLQQTNQSQPDAAAHKSTPGPSASLPSSLQLQSNCLQAITKTIKQLSQHLKVEQLNRQRLQLILLQLQNDFALSRYLLFSPVDKIPNNILPSKTPLLVLYWTLKLTVTLNITLTLPQALTLLLLPFGFPVLEHPHFVVLPRWALWDHPEQKQTILQTPISNPYPTCKKLRYRTSHQEFPNWKNCLPMKYQRTHPSLQGYILNTFYYTIKFASLNLATQMLLFGRSPQWSLYLTLQRWPDHHQIHSSSQLQVLAAPFLGLTLMATISSSNSTHMVSDPLRANVFRFYSHSSRETMTIFSNGPSQRPSILVLETSWTQWILGGRQSYPTKTQLTRSQQCQQKLELQQSYSITLFPTSNPLAKLKVS